MYNYRILIQYDGGRFDGWQRLGKDASENTVEFKIKEILNSIPDDVQLVAVSKTKRVQNRKGRSRLWTGG